MSKIIFNDLILTEKTTPSIRYGVLTSFLNKNGIQANTIYWNLVLDKVFKRFKLSGASIESYSVIKSVPFLSEISDYFNDTSCKEEIYRYTHKRFINLNINYTDFCFLLDNLTDSIIHLITETIIKSDTQNTNYVNVSFEQMQWLSSFTLSRIYKQINPNIKIIMGGFENKEEAIQAMKTNQFIDFAIWGEEEYPLLQLLQTQNSNLFSEIPRLIYRSENSINFSNVIHSELINLDDYIANDFDSYYNYVNEKNNVHPIKTVREIDSDSRNDESKKREKSPQSIISEINYIVQQYHINSFNFIDTDFVNLNKDRFNLLIDLMINYNTVNNQVLDCFVNITPNNFNEIDLKKILLAGITKAQICIESLSNSLLQKMGKPFTFADIIYLIKFSSKYSIQMSGLNIIKGMPYETKSEIIESANNLHFLRFFFNTEFTKLRFSEIPFVIPTKDSKSYKTNVSYSEFSSLISNSFFNEIDPQYFIPAYKETLYKNEWSYFSETLKNYYRNRYHYTVAFNSGDLYYTEYLNYTVINHVIFQNTDIHIKILLITNKKVTTFKSLYNLLISECPVLTIPEYTLALNELQKENLIFYDKITDEIVSIIDVNVE